ncbi:MAG: putative glycosyltransferase [Actinomycetia bacterium]|nr:putative glycosyltransferase [Actinomycetes bacterium]
MKPRPDASSKTALKSLDGNVARRLKELERDSRAIQKELRAIGKEVRFLRSAPVLPDAPDLAQLRVELDERRVHGEELARRLDEANAALAEAELTRAREAELAQLLAEFDDAFPQPVEPAQLLSANGNGSAPHLLYEDLVVRIRAEVATSLPEDANVLVVSRGDEDILRLGRRTASHFPQDTTGQYAGYHPATGEDAIAHLEALRGRGGQFLLFPSTAFWWLDHYADLRAHLEERYRPVLRRDGVCVVYALHDGATAVPAGDGDNGGNTLAEAVPLLRMRSRQVAELTGERETLAARLEQAERQLEAGSREKLARARLESFLAAGRSLEFPHAASSRATIVIPSLGQAHLLYQTLESLLATFAEEPFELVIVDNASDGETLTFLDRLRNVHVQRNERNLGFGAACTIGARLARAPYVCFLNNDTMVTPGWLHALVATLEREPDCGAVGSRLIHTDGRLQEAGGTIWRDGSGWGYGRGLDPTASEVSYRREVDYCSAASLLVRRELFLELGGFDERYAPAYYEDTDLCLGIWASGSKVVYEPRSTVFHLEFGSSGEARAVELQRRNQQRFATKWGHLLGERPAPAVENLPRARDRRSGRRVLVADDRVPNSGRGSGFPRARALLDALVQLGFVVTFMPTTDPTPYEPETSELQQLGVEVLHGARDIHATLAERPELYDVAIVSRPHNAHLLDVVRSFNPRAALVYDAEAVFAVRDLLQASVEGVVVPDAEARERVDSELGLMDGADVVLTVSEPERRLVRDRRPTLAVEVWGDCVRPRAAKPDFRARRDLLFVGALGTPPNADAVAHFLEVFPDIRRRVDCGLYVVGANPQAGLFGQRASFSEGVIFTGFVDDLTPVYDRARVFVAPHRFAAGAPHKVIEAMAHGVPCVVSQLLADQLEVTDGEEALVAADAEQLVERVARLYRDRRLWRRVQQRGLRFVERYDPDDMREKLSRILDATVAARVEV